MSKPVKSFKAALIWRIVLAASIPLLLVGLVTYKYLSDKTAADIKSKNELIAEAVKGEIFGILREPLSILTHTQVIISSHSYSDNELNELLSVTVQNTPYFESIYLISREGRIKNVGLPKLLEYKKVDYVELDLSGQKYYRQAFIRGERVWSDIFHSMITGDNSITLTIPFKERMLVGSFSIEHLNEFIRRIKAGKELVVSVVDRNGVVILHPDKTIVDQHINISGIEPIKKGLNGIFGTYRYRQDGISYVGSISQIPETGWFVLLSQETKHAFKQALFFRNLFIIGLVLTIIIISSLSYFFAAILMRPLNSFRESISQIASGSYDVVLPVQKYAEMEELAQSFRNMSSAIKSREEELKASEKKFRTLFEDSKDGIFITSRDGRFVEGNTALYKMFGYTPEESEKANVKDLYVNPDDRVLFQNVIEQRGAVKDFPVKLRKKDGTKLDCLLSASLRVDDDGNALGYQGTVRNITEKNLLEAQLSQAQKMEAIGTMAGGIAHDFNNLLAIILGNADLSLLDIPPGSPSRTRIDQVIKASRRAKDLVKQILVFSRQQEQDFVKLKPDLIVKESLKLLRATVPVSVEIRQNIDSECDYIKADPTQIHQVLMNFVSNAAYAMDDKGVLVIDLKNVDLGTEDLLNHPEALPGQYVMLSVSDSGEGIDQNIAERIFDPFFTTKEVGEGTGMGLSVVHGIVKNHGGVISFDSEPGKGSTFYVYFPKSELDAVVEPGVPESTLPTGKEHILIVDDEEGMAEMLGMMVGSLGYQETFETSSTKALATFKSNPGKFDLVITDQTMPEMTGMELAEELLRIRPDIPIILCTGYSKKVTEGKVKDMGIRELLMKPLEREQLAITVRNTLDGRE